MGNSEILILYVIWFVLSYIVARHLLKSNS